MIEGTIFESLARRGRAGGEKPPRSCLVMGILNVTPDSFSDGGRFVDAAKAAARADEMEHEGAHIIDIGGESTRPGSEPVPEDEQIRRVVPVIEKIRSASNVAISVDTTRAKVAEAALGAGADIINDISALRDDPRMGEVAAAHEAVVVLMHMLGTPKKMQENPIYGDVVEEVREFLEERRDYASLCGIDSEHVVLDPGFGFGKTVEHNLALIAGLEVLCGIGCPLLVGFSRKSTIGAVLDRPVEDRLAGSLSVAALAVLKGAGIVRAHDVKETSDAVRMAEAVMRCGDEYGYMV